MMTLTFRSSKVFVRLRNEHQPEYSYVKQMYPCLRTSYCKKKKTCAAKGAARTETATLKKWLEDVPCTVTVVDIIMVGRFYIL